jgi:hypothetical protein
MYDIELKLKEYLSRHPDIIIESLKDNFMYNDYLKINSVEIEDEYFSVKCQTIKNLSGDSISPFLPIPISFLRKIKLESIKKSVSL